MISRMLVHASLVHSVICSSTAQCDKIRINKDGLQEYFAKVLFLLSICHFKFSNNLGFLVTEGGRGWGLLRQVSDREVRRPFSNLKLAIWGAKKVVSLVFDELGVTFCILCCKAV